MVFLKVRLRRIKFWWHLIFAYLNRYKLRLSAGLFAFLLLSFLTIEMWPSITRNNLVSVGYVGVYTLETIPSKILSQVTKPLITPDQNGRPVSSLASHWTVSEDGKTYVVFLQDNLKWHDSSAVDTKDISIALPDVNIIAINNKALQFQLPNPIASFPLALDKPVFKAKSFYGTGDFRIVDIDQIDNFVKKITLHPNKKSLPKIEAKFYQTEEQAINALKIGEVKSIDLINAAPFEKWPNLDVLKTTDMMNIVTIFYNNQDELLSSKETRQVLTYAVNKSRFSQQEALGPISPLSWAHNANIKKYDYNPGKSKELLGKTNQENPQITLSYTPDLKETADLIKEDWTTVGVTVHLKEEKNIPDNFQALLAVNKLPPDPDQYGLWHSTQSTTNICNYKNVKIDKLLEDARSSSNEAKRKELYFDFQKFLVEDAPATFLYHPTKYKITYKNAKQLLHKLRDFEL